MENKVKMKVNNFYSELSKLKVEDRMAALENGLEEMVSDFRDEINKAALEKLDITTKENAPMVCEKGHSLYTQVSKKKLFF